MTWNRFYVHPFLSSNVTLQLCDTPLSLQPGEEAANRAVMEYGKHNGIFSFEGKLEMFLQEDKSFSPPSSSLCPPQSEPASW